MNELNIPKRTKGKRNTDIINSDFYKYYKEHIPKTESLAGGLTSGSYNVTAREYSDIIKDLNSSIIDIIILENFEFILPYRLGQLSVKQKEVKYKLDEDGNLNTRNLSLNYKATKDLWLSDEEAKKNKTLIFHTNEHTNNIRMSYWWSKKGAKTMGLQPYYFIPCRQVKRRLTALLKNAETKLAFFQTPKKLKHLRNPKFL